MKKIFATAMLVAALGAQVGAHASSTTGHILINNPVAPVSEVAGGCEPGGDLDGIDAAWFPVQAEKPIAVTLTTGATGLEDLDLYFWTAACKYISGIATENASESGTTPVGAAFVSVDLFTGANASFTVSVG